MAELFSLKEESSLYYYKCEKCEFAHELLKKETIYNFSCNSTLVISFNQINGNKISFHDFNDFDENCIFIPGDVNKNTFVLRAAIQFYPNNKYAVNRGGHYTCWRRSTVDGWIEISVTESTSHDNTSLHDNTSITTPKKNLKFFYLLFLLKKTFAD